MNFGEALHLMKYGRRCARKGWPAGVSLGVAEGAEFEISQPPGVSAGVEPVSLRACIMVREAGGQTTPWEAAPGDLLAEDWEEVSPGD